MRVWYDAFAPLFTALVLAVITVGLWSVDANLATDRELYVVVRPLTHTLSSAALALALSSASIAFLIAGKRTINLMIVRRAR
ncbi:hypothetical protein [Microbacterium panaciterrae]|uniref:Uncharacterized protein n=1 Tax=Microbacterium panaciterrae TaxID=985759 RepID=A0ABP8P3H1_9MICO